MTDSPSAIPAQPSGFLEDLIDFWGAPAEVFARRDGAGFFGTMMLVTVLIAGLVFANRGTLSTITEAEIRRSIAQAQAQGRTVAVSDRDLATLRKYAEFGQTAGVLVVMPVVILCLGLGAWLVGRALGATELGYGSTAQVAAWAFLPKVLDGVALSIQGLLLDTSRVTGRFQLSLGVGRFLDPDLSPGLLGLAGRLDVFTLWVSVLLGIGICTVGRLPRAKVLPAAALMWLFGALPALWQLGMTALRG